MKTPVARALKKLVVGLPGRKTITQIPGVYRMTRSGYPYSPFASSFEPAFEVFQPLAAFAQPAEEEEEPMEGAWSRPLAGYQSDSDSDEYYSACYEEEDEDTELVEEVVERAMTPAAAALLAMAAPAAPFAPLFGRHLVPAYPLSGQLGRRSGKRQVASV